MRRGGCARSTALRNRFAAQGGCGKQNRCHRDWIEMTGHGEDSALRRRERWRVFIVPATEWHCFVQLPFIGIARGRSSGLVVVSGEERATFAALKLICGDLISFVERDAIDGAR
jgi:hypothetical protein